MPFTFGVNIALQLVMAGAQLLTQTSGLEETTKAYAALAHAAAAAISSLFAHKKDPVTGKPVIEPPVPQAPPAHT